MVIPNTPLTPCREATFSTSSSEYPLVKISKKFVESARNFFKKPGPRVRTLSEPSPKQNLAQRIQTSRLMSPISEVGSPIPTPTPRNGIRNSSPLGSHENFLVSVSNKKAQSLPNLHHQSRHSKTDLLSVPFVDNPLDPELQKYLHSIKELESLVYKGNIAGVARLAPTLPPKVLNHRFRGLSILEFAAIRGRVDIVAMLVYAKARNTLVDTSCKVVGCGALYHAAKHNQRKVMEYLLDSGANPEQLCEKDGREFSMLPTAVATDSLACVKLIVSYAKNPKAFVNFPDGDILPLKQAFNQDNAEIMEFLLLLGAEIPLAFHVENEDQLCLLAAQQGHTHCVKFLLKRNDPSPLHYQTKEGITALHWAKAHRHESIVKLLLEKRAKADRSTTATTSFVGDDEREITFPEGLDYITFSASYLNEVALDCLGSYCHNLSLTSIKRKITFSNVNEALDHLLDPNSRFRDRDTLFHRLVKAKIDVKKAAELWIELKERGVNFYLKNQAGKTALQLIDDVVKILDLFNPPIKLTQEDKLALKLSQLVIDSVLKSSTPLNLDVRNIVLSYLEVPRSVLPSTQLQD